MKPQGDKCEKCGKPATFHLTEIDDGKKAERHLCEDCAAAEGLAVKASLGQLLEAFAEHVGGGAEADELACDVCGLTFAEFRKKGLLGCPNDYDAFAPALRPLLERAQGGHVQHLGKVPRGAGKDAGRSASILRLRAQLKAAIDAEDYERAASLRDQIRELEKS